MEDAREKSDELSKKLFDAQASDAIINSATRNLQASNPVNFEQPAFFCVRSSACTVSGSPQLDAGCALEVAMATRNADGDLFSPERVSRFWSNVQKSESGCWFWIGPTRQGYGWVYRLPCKHGLMLAHRYSLKMVGRLTNSELHVHHKCRNRNCVNPNHLEEVSHSNHIKEYHPDLAGLAGKAAHKYGRAHEFNSEEASLAAKRGHELGVGHKFTAEETAAAVRKNKEVMARKWDERYAKASPQEREKMLKRRQYNLKRKLAGVVK